MAEVDNGAEDGRRKPAARPSGEVTAVAGLALVLEVAPLALVGFLPLVLVATHLIVTIALVAWIALRWRALDRHMATLLVMTTVVLGPLGSGGCLLTLLIARLMGREAASFEELQKALFPEEDQTAEQELTENLTLGREQPASASTVAPFSDIGRFGTPTQKQTMIGHLARRFRAEFAPALTHVLTDPDAAVRVQAGTAVAKIENRYVERLMELEREAAAAPHDAARQRAVAEMLDDYAYNGLIDEQRQRDTRQAAVAAYRRCLALEPNSEHDRFALGRLLVRLGEVAEARELLVDLRRQSNALFWYAECLFRLGRFDELRMLFADVSMAPTGTAEASLPHRLEPVAEMWRQAAAGTRQ